MMRKIQYDTKDAVRYLQEGVKKMKLTNFEGENVERAVSLLRGAERRLRNTESGVPQDFSKWVLDIFQTSSVDAFNAQFALYNGMFSLGRKVTTAPMIQPTPGELYRLAEQTYLELVSIDAWTGITTKGSSHTGLTVGPAPHTLVCWNCGESGHNVSTCSKPKDQQRIAAGRAKFRKERKSGGPRKASKSRKPTKWAPPSKEEKGKRVINGKPFYYHYKSKRWIPETGAPAAAQVVQPTATAPVVQLLLLLLTLLLLSRVLPRLCPWVTVPARLLLAILLMPSLRLYAIFPLAWNDCLGAPGVPFAH
jgi:hypothetical protein